MHNQFYNSSLLAGCRLLIDRAESIAIDKRNDIYNTARTYLDRILCDSSIDADTRAYVTLLKTQLAQKMHK